MSKSKWGEDSPRFEKIKRSRPRQYGEEKAGSKPQAAWKRNRPSKWDAANED